MRYFLDISYKGTNYHGWQIQENALSVQEVLEAKLSMILRKKIQVVGSGRTDTGVHALQQIVHIDWEEALNESWIFKMNCVLPKDISINSYRKVKVDAHARFDATFREYEYRICRKKDPFQESYCWKLWKEPDIEKMNQAASILLKYEDFQSFSKVHTDVTNFLCSIQKANWENKGHTLVFTIRANRFLRGMVRAIVGSMVDIGLGKSSVENFERIILSRDRQEAGSASPPDGLFLTRIGYPDEIFLS